MIRMIKHRELALFALLLAMAAGCAGGQGSAPASASAEEAAQRVAGLAVQMGSHERALERGSRLAWESSVDAMTLQLGRELTAEEQDRVKAIFKTTLGEFLTAELWQGSVARVYAENFTAAELDAMFAFYSSPAGRKTLEMEGVLADAVDDELLRELASEMEAFIERVDGALAEAFPGLAGEEGS